MPDTLSHRLATAPAGSRDLDARIAKAAGWTEADGFPGWFFQPGESDKAPLHRLPKFSTSLDAITALIEARGYGGTVDIGDKDGFEFEANLWNKAGVPVGQATAATPALALAAAIAETEGWP